MTAAFQFMARPPGAQQDFSLAGRGGLDSGWRVEDCSFLLVPGDSQPSSELGPQARTRAAGNTKNGGRRERSHDPQLFWPLSPCHACEKHSSELEDPGQRKVEAFTESLLFSS